MEITWKSTNNKMGSFEIPSIGEGIVWSYDFDNGNRMRFKVKGEKHSASKVKILASVDVEKIKAATEFADYVLTESRLNQGLEFLVEQGFEKSAKSTGHFVKWISSDVFKEELDTITDNNLDPKLVGKEISNKARQWFFTKF